MDAPEDVSADAFSAFLNSLVRPEERLQEQAKSLNSSVAELSAAGYEYIQQLLFKDGNNYYQMLGLSRNAGREQIRRRYRLLISLFHPDRMVSAQRWEEQAVRRLNLGYGTLKRPEKRKEYDAGLRQQKQPQHNYRPASKRTQPPVRKSPQAPLSAAPKPAEALYRVAAVQRHPKLFVWMGIGLSVLLIILFTVSTTSDNTLMLAESPQSSAQVADRVPDSRLFPQRDWMPDTKKTLNAEKHPRQKIDAIPVANSVADRIEAVAEAMPVSGAGINTIADSSEHVSPLPEVGEALHSRPAPIKPVLLPLKEKAVAQTAGDDIRSTPDADKRVHSLVTTAEQESVEQPAQAEPVPVQGFDGAELPRNALLTPSMPITGTKKKILNNAIPYMQPEYILMQYVRAYESGDINKLLHLFTLDVQTNGGQGRRHLMDSYGKLFEATKHRRFTLKQLKIASADAGHYVAWAQVAAQTVSVQDDSNYQYGGEMTFELLPKGKRLYINKIKHNIQVTELP